MASTTLPTRDTTAFEQRRRRARTALNAARRRTVTMASEARHRYRRPSLVISGFGCIDAAAYQIGLGWGLLVTGLSLLAFEAIGSDE